MEKKDIFILIVIVVIIGLVFGINVLVNNKEEEKDTNLLSGKHYVEMVVKDYGNIVLELDADTAPITVTNFINLVNDKFYDGLTFHRIISGFMIQGGASNKEINKETIKGEFSANGIENNILHKRGVISMARTDADYNSASAQFFIMHKDYPSLDGLYAAFGHVVSGIEVVDKIAKVEPMEGTNGIVEESKQPIIESIRVLDTYIPEGEE